MSQRDPNRHQITRAMHDTLPIVFPPSQLWHGNDGNWSSFIVRVGTPEQNFRVLPSAATGEVIVPHALGCQPTDGIPANCASLRGVFDTNQQQGFVPNASTSWKQEGFYDMGLEPKLGYADDALYGTDSVGLMIQHSGGPTLKQQVVGTVRRMPFFVGYFGLSPLASNFSDFHQPQRSYLTTLKDEGLIPSLSYAYNAGAYYRSPKVFGSLTLGGYDESQFVPNNFTFPIDLDEARPTSLKLQQIIAKHTTNGSVVLLQEETYINIDFTMPYIWLPRETCDRIASLFKLQYDNATDLYLLDDAAHADIAARNPSFTFTFGDSPSLADTISIDIPYSAFDLDASWPIYNDTKNYFPIRRAANESQYTLGRAFMQEAYIIVDYERGNFSLHQAAFPPSNAQRIISIPGKGAQSPHSTGGLSKASVAGIITGSVVFVALLIIAVTGFCFRRRRLRSVEKPQSMHWSSSDETQNVKELMDSKVARVQLMSTEVLEMQDPEEKELDSKSRSELP